MTADEINRIYSFLFEDIYIPVGMLYTCWYVWLYFFKLYPKIVYLHELQKDPYRTFALSKTQILNKSIFGVIRTWVVMRILSLLKDRK